MVDKVMECSDKKIIKIAKSVYKFGKGQDKMTSRSLSLGGPDGFRELCRSLKEDVLVYLVENKKLKRSSKDGTKMLKFL